MKIAIDFGTMYSKIAIKNNNGEIHKKMFYTNRLFINKESSYELIEKGENKENGRFLTYPQPLKIALRDNIERIGNNYRTLDEIEKYINLLKDYIKKIANLSDIDFKGCDIIVTHPIYNKTANCEFKKIIRKIFRKKVKFVPESIASGLFFLNRTINPMLPILICLDIGAGTTDITIMKLPRVQVEDINRPRKIIVIKNVTGSIDIAGNILTENILNEFKLQSFDEAENKKLKELSFDNGYFRKWIDGLIEKLNPYTEIKIDTRYTYTGYLSLAGGSCLLQYYDNEKAKKEYFNKLNEMFMKTKWFNKLDIQFDRKEDIVEYLQYQAVLGALSYVPEEIEYVDWAICMDNNTTIKYNEEYNVKCLFCEKPVVPGEHYCYDHLPD